MKTKIISIICVLIIISVSSISSFGKINISENTDCYGFITTYSDFENITIKDKTNCKMRHFVNDLLREKINVYWSAENISINIKKINTSAETLFFEKGAFIIPFSGDETTDNKLISIVYNYNQSSEINKDSTKVPIYILIENLNIKAYELSESLIASHKNKVSTGEIAFLDISNRCGFLSFDFIYDNEIAGKLTNEKYNILFHAGGGPEYATFYTLSNSFIYHTIAVTMYKEVNTVRNFVSKGGGYIGSCYGLETAASGIDFGYFKLHCKRLPYHPKLPSFGFYAIADFVCSRPPGVLDEILVKIQNDSHPVCYHIDPIIVDYHFGGAKVSDVGRNVEILANFHNTNTEMDGTPSWLSTKFGKGKVVTFSPHPEIMGYFESDITHIGRTVISNSIFYTTSKGLTELQTNQIKTLYYIDSIFEQTKNLNNNSSNNNELEFVKDKLNETKMELFKLFENASKVKTLIEEIAQEENINILDKNNMTYIGYKSVWVGFEYYHHTFLNFIEESLKTINKIEEVYSLIENNPEFTEEIQSLTEEILDRLNKTDEIISRGFKILEEYYNKLIKFQNSPFRSKFKQIILRDIGHKYYWNIYKIFSYIPQIYFNSEKFLRSYWYNYETSVVI
jgi:hypothetical protein